MLVCMDVCVCVCVYIYLTVSAHCRVTFHICISKIKQILDSHIHRRQCKTAKTPSELRLFNQVPG